WVEACDRFKIAITAAAAQQRIAEYRKGKGQPTAQSTSASDRPTDIPNFSRETFVDAITEFIIADDQSLNVIESPHLRRIFMLLKSDLKDSDIPHRTMIHNHVKEVYDEYLTHLEVDIKHLAHVFLYVLDRISITSKIGWITVDNASNNDTFMATLEDELRLRNIPFNRVNNRIR
ncbi:hypothetical protein CPB84DRAFT_1697018, partial [Gymnopilus junonius]